MLTRPWTIIARDDEPAATIVAGRLPLRCYRDLPAVLIWGRRTRQQLNGAPGLAGHAIAIDLSPAIWILSAWTNRNDLLRFEGSASHLSAQTALRPRLRPATFVIWTCPAAELPVTWAEVRHRIAIAAQAT